jgi:hypothetical protein
VYTLEELKFDKDLWRGLKIIPVICDWCKEEFEVKYGTLYNVIRRDADGIYCCRKHAGAARAKMTQDKYLAEGGKACKRCGEFKDLDNFWPLPNPPYYRSECKRCRNYKPARRYSFHKDSAVRQGYDFQLTLDDFLKFWNNNCFYCGEDIHGVSLDLIDGTQGYNIVNCIPCCKSCKKFKGNLRQEEFLSICIKIANNVRDSGVKYE